MPEAVPPSLSEPPPPPALPSGTVTFLLTDIVGSTALGNCLGENDFSALIQRHHALLRREFAKAGGREFKEAGDGFWVAFADVQTALRCARDCHQALVSLPHPQPGSPLRIRTALYVAEAAPDGSDYHGLALHHAARLLSAAQGGQILVSETAESLLRHRMPDGMTIRDRGRFRLRDSVAPEHLFEALWPEMPVPETPAPRAAPVHVPVLPPVFTRFIGRETEVNEVAALLRDATVPLVTLTGIGGSGKTRLAGEAAQAVAPSFDGAVWFVALAEMRDASRLAATVAAAVGAAPGIDPWQALTEILAPQPCLLVLDNLEHLLGSESDADGAAQQVDDFLHRIAETLPSVTCLTTSRHRIGLAFEREYPVRPLPVPPVAVGGTAPDRIEAVGSVALFVDRARRVRPDFHLTARNAAAVGELCRRLDGIPLALELAAAWSSLLTPAEMLGEFRTIRQSRDRDLPERHRSVTAAVEGSYRLLRPDLRTFFCRLSVFRSGWTVAAAREVCAAPNALTLLGELRDRSLLQVEERGDGSRYQFLETLREFAFERLQDDPAEAAQAADRHVAHFAALADEAGDALKGADQAEWLARLATEHANLGAALARADAETRLQIATRLHRYWMVRGHIAEGRAWIVDTLATHPDGETGVTTPTRINALNVAGALALTAGDFDAAKPLFTQCQTLSQESSDELSSALSRVNLAIIACQQGDLNTARQEYEESLPIWRRLNRPDTLAIVLSNLGGVALDLRDLDKAKKYLEESLSLQEQDEDSLLRANTLHNLAEVAYEQCDFAHTTSLLSKCLDARLVLEDQSGTVHLIDLAARLKQATGFSETAAELFGIAEGMTAAAKVQLSSTARTVSAEKIALLQEELGDKAFFAAWERGCTKPWAQMIDFVQQEVHFTAAKISGSHHYQSKDERKVF